MQKTATIIVYTRRKHLKYGKMITKSKKYKIHDENNTCSIGDMVKVMGCRPLSKTKRFRLVEIIEKAK